MALTASHWLYLAVVALVVLGMAMRRGAENCSLNDGQSCTFDVFYFYENK
ncbi:hypothetical protein [Alicyclobacillus acidocaldarius]|uniref:Uncharacterized protein n=1 Tax=Alicyclobacillus acidocaldarius (strain Tc-4-1) TaxID=1048834 RepID=F8IF21_ALIAT|nr:hypothetical protein [Alicyclobacillus acidocaldarius]AEJ42804.1 hypothetical protein TC41_0850 [Alicyclobacillus acidocaldarius subsp. acidocaldarius Tc-4-1]